MALPKKGIGQDWYKKSKLTRRSLKTHESACLGMPSVFPKMYAPQLLLHQHPAACPDGK